MRIRIVGIVCALGLIVAAGTSSAETNPKNSLPIRTPTCGDTVVSSFRLGANMECPANGLIVGASGITIDLNGKTISGSLEDHGIATSGEPAFSKTVVRNGAVRGFQVGLWLGPTSRVLNVVAVDNEYGVRSTRGLKMERSSVVANKVGYHGTGDEGVVLVNNRFSANDKGIVIDLGDRVPLTATATRIRKNTIAGNLEHGIFVDSGTEHVIEENVVSGNGHWGGGNGFPGIELDPQATYIKTIDNRIDGNGDDGYRDDGANNTASRNTARGNGFYDIDGVGTGIEHGTNAGGIKNDALGNDATTQCTLASMCVIDQPASKLPLMTPACGSTVTQSFRLGADVTCPGAWISVATDGVTIDLNRKTVRGPGRDIPTHPFYVGISFGSKDNVTVRNGAVRGFDSYGIFASTTNAEHEGGKVVDVVVAGNSTGIGLFQDRGEGGGIHRVVASGNFHGFDVDRTTVARSATVGNLNRGVRATLETVGLRLEDNLIAGNLMKGIELLDLNDGSDVVITGNQVLGNGHVATKSPQSGVVVWPTVEGARIHENIIEGNAGLGLDIRGHGTSVKHNAVRGNGYWEGIADEAGIGLDASTDTAVQGLGNDSIGNDAPDQCEPDFLCPGAWTAP